MMELERAEAFMSQRILFICKERSYGVSSGLSISAALVAQMLRSQHGIACRVVSVVDANCIDKEVAVFRPTHVVIEAIWAPPWKLQQLLSLHPRVKWAVRVHSKTPFLATEGVAIQWIREYCAIGKRLVVAPNSESLRDDLGESLGLETTLLPNYYPVEREPGVLGLGNPRDDNRREIDIGCFGAIRPLKNQLIQAMAAIAYAESRKKALNFYINAGRVERGEEELKNIRSLFAGSRHKLIEHGWLDHHDFLRLVIKMDAGLQVSLTESFNIVAADFVACNVPIVGSPDIEWLHPSFTASPNSSTEIRHAIGRVISLTREGMMRINVARLQHHDERTERLWMRYLG
jgi:hypothetical protein